MNKLVVCTAAFSLALLACVEDPVSSALPATGNGESSAVAESSSATLPASSETVATSSTPAPESSAAKPASSASVESSSATAPASSESVTPQSIPFLATCVNDVVYVDDPLSKSSDVAPPSAYKFYTPAGIPVLTLKGSYFEIPCDKKQAESFMSGLNSGDKSVASFAYLVSGDTLYARVSRSKGFSYGCSCAAEVSFGFEEGGTYIQYVSFEHNEVIPAPEMHYVIAPSSSSFVPASSSSESSKKTSRQVDDISAMCIKDDTSDGIENIPSVAYVSGRSDSVTFVLERVKYSCGTQFTSLEVSLSGDTVVVKPKVDPETALADCICATRMTFSLKADSAITNAKILVIKDADGGQVREKMRVIRYDRNVYDNRPSELDKNGFNRGVCVEEERLSAQTEGLPEATLIVYEDGRSVLSMNYVEDYCDVRGTVLQKVVGDTLFFDYSDDAMKTECFCTFSSHNFIVDMKNVGSKYVSFNSNVYRIVPITYTKIPNWEL